MLFMKPFKVFVYIQVYVIDYDVTNTEMVDSNVYVLVVSKWESQSDDIAEVN